ncbi:hypothetical protein CC79DRAFT_1366406 [Sarocladium strictum]
MKSHKKRRSKSKGRSSSVDFSFTKSPPPPVSAPSNKATASSKTSSPQRVPARRSKTAPSFIPSAASLGGTKPDYVLVSCYVLLYLELGWLALVLWRSWGSPSSWLLPI